MILKCFTVKHLQNVVKHFSRIEHGLKIDRGYMQNKTFTKMF